VAPKIGTFGDFASLDLAAIYEQRRSDLNVTIENLRGNVALRETTLMSARERGGGESRGSDGRFNGIRARSPRAASWSIDMPPTPCDQRC